MSRWMGIDFGEKRIGLALSNPEGSLALPWGFIERTTDRRAVGQIAGIVSEYEIQKLVLGYPRHPDGTATELGSRVVAFAEKLRRRTGLDFQLLDEAHTSIEAEQRLASVGPKGRVDAIAAQIILQEALDRDPT